MGSDPLGCVLVDTFEDALMENPFSDCWFLTGPTASSKTDVGLDLAAQLNAEIISLDSMAVYRGMDIGTAKPTAEQQRTVRHHLIDVLDPDTEFSLANYVEMAKQTVDQIQSQGKVALFVGGTPLYLKALLRGIFDGPPADWEFRRQIEEEVQQVGVQALHDRLRQVDPLSANKLPPGDVRRIIRALEVYKLTGKPISHWQMQFDEGRQAEECHVYVLSWPREALHQRISDRVDAMFQRGLVEEVAGLLQRYQNLGRTAAQAVGYREIIEHLAGEGTLDETVERVKVRTRRFAKRQRTWFRGLSECQSVEMVESETPLEVAERILGHSVQR